MGPVISRFLAALQNVVDDDVPIQRIRQRKTNLNIVQCGVALIGRDVDQVSVGAGIRGRHCLVGEFLFQAWILACRNGGPVQLARLKAREGCVFVVYRQRGYRRHYDIGRIPVGGAFLHHHFLARNMLLQKVCTITHQIFRLGPVGTEFLYRRLMDRKGRVMSKHFGEIGQRGQNLHFQCVVIQRLDAQIGDRLGARDDFSGIYHLHQFHVPGVFRGGRGIDQALPAINEITCGDRITIGPFRVGAQGESIGC